MCMRSDAEFFNANRRNRLKPNRLPNSGRTVVIDFTRQTRVRLFAARLLRILRVFNSQREPICSGSKIRSNIKLKRNVTALVVSDLSAVYPNHGRVIDRAEVQQQFTTAPRFGDFEIARIPNTLMDRLIIDAGQLSLIGERNSDAARKLPAIVPAFCEALVGIVESEFPLAIQVQPFVSHELRAGLLGSR